jgi:hypothetical protein
MSRENLNDHSAKIKTPTTPRKAVKPKLREVEMAPLVLLEAAPDPVLVEVPDPPDVLDAPDVPDGVADELELVELEASARARNFVKVLPDVGALIAPTIPEAQ